MTVATTITVLTGLLREGDLYEGRLVSHFEGRQTKGSVVFMDGGTRTVRIDAHLEVVREMPTWADKIVEYEREVEAALASIIAVTRGEDGSALIDYQTEAAEAGTASDALQDARNLYEHMVGLHVEAIMQKLGEKLGRNSIMRRRGNSTLTDLEVVVEYAAEVLADQIDWGMPHTSPPAVRLIEKARHDAYYELNRSNGLFRKLRTSLSDLDELKLYVRHADVNTVFVER